MDSVLASEIVSRVQVGKHGVAVYRANRDAEHRIDQVRLVHVQLAQTTEEGDVRRCQWCYNWRYVP